MLVEVGRSMSQFLKYIGLTGGVGVVASLYSELYMGLILQCLSLLSLKSAVRTAIRM